LPIPPALGASAAEVAREHGVFHTAKVLRLEYGKLKRMVESAAPVKRAATPPAKFLELVTPEMVGVTECVIELEGPRGKMRIQWKGGAAPDLAGLGRALWESA
jgi:transposase-like protein